MRTRDILSHKKQSLTKWKLIVVDLDSKEPQMTLELTHEDCGYCKVYYNSNVDDEENECEGCPLDKPLLCYNGEGTDYQAVLNYYLPYPSSLRPEEVERKAALKGARGILKAIKKDLST